MRERQANHVSGMTGKNESNQNYRHLIGKVRFCNTLFSMETVYLGKMKTCPLFDKFAAFPFLLGA